MGTMREVKDWLGGSSAPMRRTARATSLRALAKMFWFNRPEPPNFHSAKFESKAQLYRHFDRDGRLLYVGISLSVMARLAGHRDESLQPDHFQPTQGGVAPRRISVTITNTTTTPIWIGSASVDTTHGAFLAGIVGASITINTTAAVYGPR